MKELTTIGIDIAKNFIQIHGADARGKRLFKKRVARDQFLSFMDSLPRCLVGMEACGGAHYWTRKLIELGFDAKLMSARKVKKYVENNKNDEKDAAACAEAVTRANMTFVTPKEEIQQEMQSIHRARSYYISQRTALTNMMRGLLLEIGIAIPKGQSKLVLRLNQLLAETNALSFENCSLFSNLLGDLKRINDQVDFYSKKIQKVARCDELCRNLQTISGIAEITATALVAKIGNGSEFKNGRELSAYLGLVPKQASSGEKQQLLGISKHGDRYIRQLLIHGGRSSVKGALRKDTTTGLYIKNDAHTRWIRELTSRVGKNKASVAVANKNARMVIAVFKSRKSFDPIMAHSNNPVHFGNSVDKCQGVNCQSLKMNEALIAQN